MSFKVFFSIFSFGGHSVQRAEQFYQFCLKVFLLLAPVAILFSETEPF